MPSSPRPARCVLLALLLLALPIHLAAAQSAAQLTQSITDSVAKLGASALESYRIEVGLLLVVLLFAVNFFGGSRANTRLAHTWLRRLAAPGGVLQRHFTVVPSPDTPNSTWRDSPNCFRAYATGRRHCTGAMLTINTVPRQDLFFRLWGLVQPFGPPPEDTLTLQVPLSEGSVPPGCLLVAAGSRVAKAQLKQWPGIRDYAKEIKVSRERANTWSADLARSWVVWAESSALLYDCLNAEPAIARAFGGPCFRSMLFSSEAVDLPASDEEWGGNSSSGSGQAEAGSSSSSSSGGTADGGRGKSPPVNITFCFALPASEARADEVQQLVAAALSLVDLLGSYKVSPEMRKRAQELRAAVAQKAAKRRSENRQGELAAKRAERLEAERAKARAAGPAALQKFEERLQKQMRNREMRKRTVRA